LYAQGSTHTISYIQQVNHEWIKGDEEEIAYASYQKLEGDSY
jgi:hypothetical protein